MNSIDLRRLVIRSYHVNEVKICEKFNFHNGVLSIDKNCTAALLEDKLVKAVNIQVIQPHQHNIEVNTIMDIIPISVKALGKLGSGITHTITGAYFMLTSCDEDGNQMHEFGSSEGILKEKLKLNMAGTPSSEDIIIHVDVLLKGGEVFDRHLPLAAFKACDEIISYIREVLRVQDARNADEVHEFYDKIRIGAKKVAIVKQVAGQGAMYDNWLFPDQPSGYGGGVSVIDIGNMPVVLSPNEYRDGALRAMV